MSDDADEGARGTESGDKLFARIASERKRIGGEENNTLHGDKMQIKRRRSSRM